MSQRFLLIGSVLGFLGVAIGAFGAHVLKRLIEPALFAIFQTAVQYHFYHALALLALGVLATACGQNTFALRWAGYCFVLGVGLFSGSLYLMALTGIRGFGLITPIGGIAWLVGWVLLAIAVSQIRWSR